MRVLSLTEPWATLVAIGEKSIETRSWGTSYRGPVIIHAAKKVPRDARLLAALPPFDTVLAGRALQPTKVLAVADLTQCFRFTERTHRSILVRSAGGLLPRHEADFGDFDTGRWGFILRDVRALPEPIAAKGALGLWIPDAKLVRAIEEQLEGVPA
jgi:hypothetical protein